MRKLIVTSIISVLIIIGCFIYFEYDIRKFKKEMSQVPLPSKQQVNTAKNSIDTSVDDKQKTDQLDNENTPSFSQEESTQDDTQTILTNEDAANEVNEQNLQLASVDAGISPELKKTFVEIHPIYKQITEINEELGPLKNQNIKIGERQQEIIQKNVSPSDKEKWSKLYTELNELTQLGSKLSSKITILQNQVEQLGNEMTQILKENGFSDEMDFYKSHWNTYESWASEQ